MAVKITGDNLQYDDTAVATLAANKFTLASTAQFTASAGVCITGSLTVNADGGGDQIQFNSDVEIDGNLTVLGTQTLGDAEADSLSVSGHATFDGELTASMGMFVPDDKKLYFGSGFDASFEYDEDGTDQLRVGLPAAGMVLAGTTPKLVIGDAGAEDTMLVFDGNAQDYRMGLDDGTDVLELGVGSTHGTTTSMKLDSSLNVDVAGHNGSVGLKLGGTLVTATAAELNYVDIASLGTAAASKALVADASAEIDAGAITFTDLGTVTTVDINGGTADNVTIGGGAPAAGTFTNLTASSFAVMDGMTFGMGFDAANGAGSSLQIGASTRGVTSSVYATWRPGADDEFDLGASGAEWKDLYIDGTAYLDAVDIDAGAIDGVTIGSNSAATALTVNGGTVSITDTGGDGAIDGCVIGANTAAAGTFTSLVAGGDVDLGDATSDTITATGRFDSDLVPSTDSARALGSAALQWSAAHVDVGHIDQLGSALDANSQVITNVDINSGYIDGTRIGGSNPDAGDFTSLNASGKLSGSNGIRITDGGSAAVMSLNDTDGFDLTVSSVTIVSNTAITGTLNVSGNFVCDSDILPDEDGAGDLGSSALQWAEAHVDHGYIDDITATGTSTLTTVDINGGAIDGTVIGANSAANGTFDVLAANGNVTLGNAATDVTTVTGHLTASNGIEVVSYIIPSADDAADLGSSTREWRDLYLDGTAYLDTVDIDAGAIDGVTIGSNSAATALTVNGGTVSITDTGGDGTMDGVIVGGTTAAAGTFTAAIAATVSGSTSVSSPRYTTHGGGAFQVDADTDWLTLNPTEATFANDVNVKALSFVTYSDATLKQDIKPLDNALDKVMSMRGVTYEFKNGHVADGAAHREVGFLAQEMKQTVPEVVYGNGDGNLGIDYAKLTSVLVEAVKSQQDQIEELRAALLKKIK